jgi:hypothetical protein
MSRRAGTTRIRHAREATDERGTRGRGDVRSGRRHSWIGPGEYFVKQGLALDARHSGTAARPLVIRGTEPARSDSPGAGR